MNRKYLAVLVVPISLLLLLGACHIWSAPQEPTPMVISKTDGPIRITRKGDKEWLYEMKNAKLVGDSLIGNASEDATRIAIPVANIQSIVVRQFSRTRTNELIFGIIVTGVAIGVYEIVTHPMFSNNPNSF